MDDLAVPDAVRHRAISLGAPGEAWLAGLPDKLAQLSVTLGLATGRVLEGGTSALVTEATLIDGRAAVLKVFLPGGGQDFAGERAVLRAARGRGYAELLAADVEAEALVLERLGPNLRSRGLSAADEMSIICRVLPEAWACPIPPGLTDGAQKARDLAAWVETKWAELDQPCPRTVVTAALEHARDRETALDPALAVTGHGDCHAWNTLEAPGSPHGYKFVDPDGLFVEPAYDLGVLLREWVWEPKAGSILAQGRARCLHLSAETRISAEAIWRWGYLERASTGLAGLEIGLPGSQAILDVAEAWLPGL